MASFKPVQRLHLPRLKGEPTPDNKYWSDFEFPVSVKEYGPVQSISFSRTKPHYFAVTASAKVQVFSPFSLETHKTFSRFKEAAYGAEFRSDGKLLAVGGEEGFVRVFDTGTKSMLREFKNHKAPVHCTRFTVDKTHVLSFGDDRAVRYFDIPAQTQVRSFKNHGDYVRSGDASLSSQDIVVSGSYDHKARVFDLRTSEAVLEVDHGAPVEAVLMFPSGNVFMTAGGTNIKVWDVVCGATCLTSVANHHKTITDLCFASNYQRFLSSSIDRHVKVYDVSSYSLVHSMDFPEPVLSIGVSMDDELMCVGMTNGVVAIHKRKQPVDEEALEEKKLSKKPWRNKYLLAEKHYQHDEDAIVIKEDQRAVLLRHDKYLKRFEFTKALDQVLKYYIWGQKPDITVAVIQELDRRNGLVAAISGRSPEELIDLLGFLVRYITDQRYATVVLGVADLVWETYPYIYGKSKEVDRLVTRLQEILELEIRNQKDLKLIIGNIDALLSASELNSVDSQTEITENVSGKNLPRVKM